MVLSPSEAHSLGEIFEVYVCQRKAIVVSKLPQKIFPRKFLHLFRCMAVLYLGVYLFPGDEAVSPLRRAFLVTL